MTPPRSTSFHSWIHNITGTWIPRYKICDNHCAPFEHLHDRYFQHQNKTIALAARGTGKSYNTGLECWISGRFKSNWGAVILGGSLDQSEKSYKATESFWNATEEIGGGIVLAKEPNSKITKFKNGSWYKISTASTKSARGPHQQALFLDEIDEMEREVLDSAMMQPQTMDGYDATWSFTSTRHKTYGLMSEWVDNAADRGFALYTWCILEAMEPCVDYSCSTCLLNAWCGGRMKPAIEQASAEQCSQGLLSKAEPPIMGFNTVEDVISKVEFATGDVFDPTADIIDVDADLFCLKPSRLGLVYKEYDTVVHCVSDMKIYSNAGDVVDLEVGSYVMDTWQRYRTFDFGLDDPMAILDCFVDPQGRIYVYEEIYVRGLTELDVVSQLTNGVRYEFQVGDISAAGPKKNLNRFGIRLVSFKQGINEGIVLVRNQMKTRSDGTVGLYVNKKLAPYTNWELASGYRYPEAGRRDIPADANNHAADGLRYLIYALRKGNIWQSSYRGK